MHFVKKLRKTLPAKFQPITSRIKSFYKKFYVFAQKSPIKAFVVLLLVLFSLIFLSNILSKPAADTATAQDVVKEVSVYAIGTSPKITVQAVVEKSGVVKIVTLSGGVVQAINVFPGQSVYRGTNLLSLSSNYQGGNIFSVQRQLAQVQYKNVLDTYQTNKDLIGKQRELASANDDNSDELRAISNQSLDSTRGLINLNNEILNTLAQQQADLEALPQSPANDAAILQTKQLRSQLLSGNSQLQAGLRQTEYSGSADEPPAQLSNLGKDIALKQLELQEKALDLNKEISRLSLVLAQISESMMYPSSPFNGTVERVYVKIGESVAPGTPLVQISGNSKSLTAVALLSREMASGISQADMSTLHLGKKKYESAPFYVSTEATEGSLYSAQFSIPEEYNSEVTDNGYITIDIPMGLPQTGSAIPFIPVDSVFQTQDQAFLFVVKNQKAESRTVVLGEVIGRFVEVKSGLKDGDVVILNRNVISGDKVKIIN